MHLLRTPRNWGKGVIFWNIALDQVILIIEKSDVSINGYLSDSKQYFIIRQAFVNNSHPNNQFTKRGLNGPKILLNSNHSNLVMKFSIVYFEVCKRKVLYI